VKYQAQGGFNPLRTPLLVYTLLFVEFSTNFEQSRGRIVVSIVA